MSQAQNAGFAFWERSTLVQFATQATEIMRAICEIADNNNPASVMHDDPRKALEQIEAIALGLPLRGATALSSAQDTDRLNWIERQHLEEIGMGLVIDAPNDGQYYINGDDGKTHYGHTLREAIDKARASGA